MNRWSDSCLEWNVGEKRISFKFNPAPDLFQSAGAMTRWRRSVFQLRVVVSWQPVDQHQLGLAGLSWGHLRLQPTYAFDPYHGREGRGFATYILILTWTCTHMVKFALSRVASGVRTSGQYQLGTPPLVFAVGGESRAIDTVSEFVLSPTMTPGSVAHDVVLSGGASGYSMTMPVTSCDDMI
ncbi:hypothetical protein FIBSPDRAFT_1007101 [Athelia psychrophila]|uniref:Uncharacterized protein n=1 Tax=Athelia psychrophila TaxID=1759441 RepID=A0A166VUC2_9AGAM|nr:hypothetical protein FIBSPDRAFT_1007101 [Fibularhizoctonia sp. CBS 109695]